MKHEMLTDLVVENVVLVELKAVKVLEASHEKQVFNYLRATNIEVGLLLNFGPRPQVRRIILENEYKLQSKASSSFTLLRFIRPIRSIRSIRSIRVLALVFQEQTLRMISTACWQSARVTSMCVSRRIMDSFIALPITF